MATKLFSPWCMLSFTINQGSGRVEKAKEIAQERVHWQAVEVQGRSLKLHQ